jgi:hypothetical protein
MPLPFVQHGILDGLNASPINGAEFFDRLEKENPRVLTLLRVMEKRGDNISGAIAMYRMLEAQAQADDLNNLFT